MSEIQRVEPVTPDEYLSDKRQCWDRLDDEPIEDFAAFRAYREMGKARSIAKLADAADIPRSALQRLSARNSWVARVEQYDAECHRLALASLEDGQLPMRERHAEMAAKLMAKVDKAVELVDPRFIHPRDIPIWMDVSAKLERISRGATDTKRIEITGKDGEPIKVATEMTSEDRKALLDQMAAELEKRQKAVLADAIDNIIEGEIVEDDE